ncbi:hypothetical protein MPSEU_000563000 [Mayamaea pseudoterrestris]|nr:hypothetical protein MPSEU_000563000 [Mayamaea pseudoterrestris]
MRCLYIYLFVILTRFWMAVEGFTPRNLESSPRTTTSPPATFFPAPKLRTTCLHETAWERIGLEENDEPYWYVLNCVAGLEPLLLQQCRQVCKNLSDAHRFVVPVTRTTRSHGAKRMVSETKVKFPGYVFAKLRLCPDVYEALTGLDLMRSFMGTIHFKRQRRLPPVPIALNEMEVENYGLEEWVDDGDEERDQEEIGSAGSSPDGNALVIVDSAEAEAKAAAKHQVTEEDLKVYKGLKVDDMVKVTKKSQYFGDDGVVRRLKDGQIFVRFYTYGSTFDVWLQPDDVRKLSSMEILQGLSGPKQPITQQDIDGPSHGREQRRGDDYDGFQSQRQPFNVMRGAPQPRNRRQDRAAAEFHSRDRPGGRNDGEQTRDERNWNWYQGQQRQRQEGGRSVTASDSEGRVFQATSSENDIDAEKSNWSIGDADSQWGRKPERQQRRERNQGNLQTSSVPDKDDWSSFVTSARSAAPQSKSDSDNFFDSLVADLSKEMGGSKVMASADRNVVEQSSEDDFFASLMTEFTDTTSETPRQDRQTTQKANVKGYGTVVASPDDDFFASLEQQLEEMNEGQETSYGISAQLAADDFLEDVAVRQSSVVKEAIIGEAGDSMSETIGRRNKRSGSSPEQASAHAFQPFSDRTPSDFTKMTIPNLKQVLRERGLKVSGTKAELIERLTSQSA